MRPCRCDRRSVSARRGCTKQQKAGFNDAFSQRYNNETYTGDVTAGSIAFGMYVRSFVQFRFNKSLRSASGHAVVLLISERYTKLGVQINSIAHEEKQTQRDRVEMNARKCIELVFAPQ
ncbi:unnamed protein product [Lasius platythorax]|uniref:Uncharacterized protein n=1 Tax=Lasius platythorax TaxID=488582 RepID=A0AAV2PBK5_9HYME